MTKTLIFVIALSLTPLVAWLASVSKKELELFGKGRRGRDPLDADELKQAREVAEARLTQADFSLPPQRKGTIAVIFAKMLSQARTSYPCS